MYNLTGTPSFGSTTSSSVCPLVEAAEGPPTKLLSILCQGRNDSYMGNFTWRLSTVLNNYARSALFLGLEQEVEFIVSDWGSEVPLHEVLELSSEARRMVKFLITPPQVTKVYDKDAGFAGPHPTNAAARRARGKYLMFADSDVFIPLESLTKLIYHLREGHVHDYSLDESFFWASRTHVPNDFVEQNPLLEEVDLHIKRNWESYAHDQVSIESFLGAGLCLLMKREMWLESTGWDERLIYWGWNDIDWHRRLVWKYRWNDLERYGMKMYHLEHYKGDRSKDFHKNMTRKMNDMNDPTEFAPNPSDWGLRDVALKMVDGYGLEVDSKSSNSKAKELTTFRKEVAPISVSELVVTNKVYESVAKRFPYNPHTWWVNGDIVSALMPQVQPRTIAEIGSWLGGSARAFLKFPSVEKIFCVDHWDKKRVENYVPGGMPERLMNNMYEQFLANAVHSGISEKVYPIRLNSVEGAEYCHQHGLTFDMIYIDGEHSTLGVQRDIELWHKLLSPNGLLCGDDWSWQKEPNNVAGAVMRMAEKYDWEVFAHGNFWFVVPKAITATWVS